MERVKSKACHVPACPASTPLSNGPSCSFGVLPSQTQTNSRVEGSISMLYQGPIREETTPSGCIRVRVLLRNRRNRMYMKGGVGGARVGGGEREKGRE